MQKPLANRTSGVARGVGETAWGVAKGVVLVAMGGVGMAVAERAEAAVVEGMVGVADRKSVV